MNVGIGTEAAQFLFWEYLLRIFGTVSLQCVAALRSIHTGKICAFLNVPRGNTCHPRWNHFEATVSPPKQLWNNKKDSKREKTLRRCLETAFSFHFYTPFSLTRSLFYKYVSVQWLHACIFRKRNQSLLRAFHALMIYHALGKYNK